jgi:EamA domain-containing membrane protein RarD
MEKNHTVYYICLTVILLAGVAVIISLSPDKQAQMVALVGLSIVYAAFGLIHHALLHNLVGKIVVEYILIAILGIAMALFIYRGGFGI